MKRQRDPSYGEYVTRLIREFGADVQVSLHQINPDKYSGHNRRAVNSSMYHTFPELDVQPFEFSTALPLVSVLWERPQADRDPARQLMTRTLAEHGVWEPNVSHLWCVPVDLGHPPLARDMARYRLWVLDGLLAAGSEYVLLVGTRPMWMWRPEMKLVNVQGKMFIWRQRHMVMPVANPASKVSNKTEYREWRQQVGRLVGIMMSGMDTEAIETTCIMCGENVYWYDPDGVAWCNKHYEQGAKDEAKGAKRWQMQTISAGNNELWGNGT